MASKKPTIDKPVILKEEKDRLRAMKIVQHDFAIYKDEFKRDRVVPIATANRSYDIGGMKTVVRVRNVDPLQGLSALTFQQRQAGARYREVYETCIREGLKTGSWEMRVDGGGGDRDRPERISDAHKSMQAANRALGYGEIQRTVEAICGDGMSLRSLEKADRNPRAVISALLGMGLQKLAVHYGMVPPPKRS